MGTFLLLLLFFFIILPIIRVAVKIYMVKRKMSKAFEQYSRQQQQHNQQSRNQSSPNKSNRYDNIGEYADFEEIKTDNGDNSASAAPRRSSSRESQIVDAEWEDIK